MPSAQQLEQLNTAMEAHQKRLTAAIARAAPGPLREQLLQSQQLLAQTHKDLIAATEQHNQELAAAVQSAKDASEKAKVKAEELIQNAPKPRPRPPKAGPVADPHLEEKLQLALRTPFGNRGK